MTDAEVYRWIVAHYAEPIGPRLLRVHRRVLLDGDHADLLPGDLDKVLQTVRHARACIAAAHEPVSLPEPVVRPSWAFMHLRPAARLYGVTRAQIEALIGVEVKAVRMRDGQGGWVWALNAQDLDRWARDQALVSAAATGVAYYTVTEPLGNGRTIGRGYGGGCATCDGGGCGDCAQR
ncbi:hypothetical protein I5H08_gp020 [Mycobacterium phage Yuna]|uniref:Helix-turn-helix DNA binding domain protein n=1 Tax=Mycobacterium phage Yuna TaxID=2599885 RepID=A0A5J6THS4_9CAUD|nr:hypothetical protein I5H08_gp020 [Mycobacterium phage Yuna]QFG09467.1 hypothetical protein PBI_YUNA_85 [Mycobacterium phage Yuna]